MAKRAEVLIWDRLGELDKIGSIPIKGNPLTQREYLKQNPYSVPRSDIALVNIYDGDKIVDQKCVYATKTGCLAGDGVQWLDRKEKSELLNKARKLAEAAKTDEEAAKYIVDSPSIECDT